MTDDLRERVTRVAQDITTMFPYLERREDQVCRIETVILRAVEPVVEENKRFKRAMVPPTGAIDYPTMVSQLTADSAKWQAECEQTRQESIKNARNFARVVGERNNSSVDLAKSQAECERYKGLHGCEDCGGLFPIGALNTPSVDPNGPALCRSCIGDDLRRDRDEWKARAEALETDKASLIDCINTELRENGGGDLQADWNSGDLCETVKVLVDKVRYRERWLMSRPAAAPQPTTEGVGAQLRFVMVCPNTGEELARAHDVQKLPQTIHCDDCSAVHTFDHRDVLVEGGDEYLASLARPTPTPEPPAVRIGHADDCAGWETSYTDRTQYVRIHEDHCDCHKAAVVALVGAVEHVLAQYKVNSRGVVLMIPATGRLDKLSDALAALDKGE